MYCLLLSLNIIGVYIILRKISPFDIVYGFSPLIPLDLMFIPVSERLNMDSKKKAEFVRNFHAKVKANIEKKN